MKNLVKMLLIAMLIASILPAANAASVSEQVAAPEYLSETFVSNSGKTTVTIEANVVVPQAESVNVYAVEARLFTAAELERCAATVFEGREYEGSPEYRSRQLDIAYGETVTQYSANYDTLEQGEGHASPVPVSEMIVTIRQRPNGMMTLSEIDYQRWNSLLIDPDIVRFAVGYRKASLPNGETPQGCSISQEEAKAQADAIADKVAPHMDYVACGILDRLRFLFDFQPLPNVHQAWIFYYAPVYDIPCNLAPVSLVAWQYGKVNLGVSSNEESLRIVINDDGLQALNYSTPNNITETLQEDCALLPFDEIMTIARSQMPFTATSVENNADAQRKAQVNVYEIRLGYMRVLRSDQPDSLMLVPVWDFYGTTRIGVSFDDSALHSMITINAIDGTVIDRSYGF